MLKLLNLLRIPLSRREGFYLLSLLVPFFVYNLALKAVGVLSEHADYGLLGVLTAMWSDAFFGLGYAVFWVGLYAAVRKGFLSLAVLVLFHLTAMLVMIVNACAYQYFKVTGAMLDYFTLDEIQPILFQEEGARSGLANPLGRPVLRDFWPLGRDGRRRAMARMAEAAFPGRND